jgi:hypothetical protein
VTNGTVELPTALPEWDYDTVLALARSLIVDGARARTFSGLPENAEIDLTVRWTSSSSLLRGRAWRVAVPPADRHEFHIGFELPGDELGGNLELHTLLTLRRTSGYGSAVAPSRPGSLLWQDRFSVLLQGDAALFPLAVVDFDQLPYPDRASWHLEIGEDLEAAALGSVLLLANERRQVVVSALESAGDPSDADRRVLSFVRSEVLRGLIEHALVHDDFTDEVAYPAGSLGALLRAVLRRAFPMFSVAALRRERQAAPLLFTTRIQDAADMLVAP